MVTWLWPLAGHLGHFFSPGHTGDLVGKSDPNDPVPGLEDTMKNIIQDKLTRWNNR
jgi:hypothetical protein